MGRTTKAAGATAEGGAAAEAPAIEPEAHYRVEAPARFRFRGVAFGPLVETDVDGAFLAELLDAPEGAGVAGYARVDG